MPRGIQRHRAPDLRVFSVQQGKLAKKKNQEAMQKQICTLLAVTATVYSLIELIANGATLVLSTVLGTGIQQ